MDGSIRSELTEIEATKSRWEENTTDEFLMQPQQKWCGYYQVLDGTRGYERVHEAYEPPR